jgi:hypothetical protein
MIGSGTLVSEPNYVWQPSGPLSWPHVVKEDSEILEKVAKTRREWQSQGMLSSRVYPANIVFSESG